MYTTQKVKIIYPGEKSSVSKLISNILEKDKETNRHDRLKTVYFEIWVFYLNLILIASVMNKQSI